MWIVPGLGRSSVAEDVGEGGEDEEDADEDEDLLLKKVDASDRCCSAISRIPMRA